jgi:hypothetical protein
MLQLARVVVAIAIAFLIHPVLFLALQGLARTSGATTAAGSGEVLLVAALAALGGYLLMRRIRALRGPEPAPRPESGAS